MGKENIDAVDGNVKKKVLRCLKYSQFEKKKSVISYLCFVFSDASAIGR